MKSYTIEIKAKTESDAELALDEVRKAIAKGYVMAPWNSDGYGSGYSFTSTGDFDQIDDEGGS